MLGLVLLELDSLLSLQFLLLFVPNNRVVRRLFVSLFSLASTPPVEEEFVQLSLDHVVIVFQDNGVEVDQFLNQLALLRVDLGRPLTRVVLLKGERGVLFLVENLLFKLINFFGFIVEGLV